MPTKPEVSHVFEINQFRMTQTGAKKPGVAGANSSHGHSSQAKIKEVSAGICQSHPVALVASAAQKAAEAAAESAA